MEIMENPVHVNRIETAVNRWRSREERLGSLFPFSLDSNRALTREKLHYFDRVAARYQNTADSEERFALKVLRQERRRVEKVLYPNRWLRLFRRLLVVPVRKQITVRRENHIQRESNSQLHGVLQRSGFSGLGAAIDRKISQGAEHFRLPVSRYLNEHERLDYELSFSRDTMGGYRFDGFKAGLHNEQKPGENRQHFFKSEDGLTVNTKEAYNLLSGRAVQREGRWMQFDLNDRDAKGNYRIKEFHSGYDFDLGKTLQALPLKEHQREETSQKLTDALKKGSRESVTFLKDGHEQRYYIEANPQLRTVNIYDGHSRKITLQTAIGNKIAEGLKTARKVDNQDKQQRKGMRVM